MTDRVPPPDFVLDFLSAAGRALQEYAERARGPRVVEVTGVLAVNMVIAGDVATTDDAEVTLIPGTGITRAAFQRVRRWAAAAGVGAVYVADGMASGPLESAGEATFAEVVDLAGRLIEWTNHL